MSNWLQHRRTTLLLGLASLALVALGAWFTRDAWLTWYYMHGLKHASEQDREIWIHRVASLGSAAVPSLVDVLKEQDASTCESARLALEELCQSWGADHEHSKDVYARLAKSFEGFSFAGQQAVLKLYAPRLREKEQGSADLVQLAAHPLQSAMKSSCKDVRATAYELLIVLVRTDHATERQSLYRDFLRRGFKEDDPLLRARAVCAAAPEQGVQDDVVPLLHDPAPEVRRAAMLAVGPATTVIHDDDLLPWLNDEDEEVRHLCEMVLEGRGIPKESIRLARMITHPKVAVRLQAVTELLVQPERDATEWYRRLTYDTCPSVQIAAVRAARQQHLDLRERLLEMAQGDKSDSVRQLAGYYLGAEQ